MSRLQSAAGRVPQDLAFGHWSLRRKLAAALVLPVLLALVLGGLRVKSDFDQATELTRASEASKVVKPLIDYNAAVQTLATSAVTGGPARNTSVAAYEKAAAALTEAVKNGNISTHAKAEVDKALDNGKGVRTVVDQKGALSVVIDKASATAAAASEVVASLGLSSDDTSARSVIAIQDTIAAQRSMTAQQLYLENTSDTGAIIGTTGQVGAESSFLSRLKAEVIAQNSFDVQRLTYDNFRRGTTLQSASGGSLDRKFLAGSYKESGAVYATVVQREMDALDRSLNTRSADLRMSALINAGLVAIALLATLILVLALIKSLLTPIRAVRMGALDIANKRLPEAVAKIRDGEEAPAFEPIPVTTHEEIGQLARAVDDLHTQALTLAGDQARLRVQVGHMFETLSRRSTSLIDQQLSLIERLESDEEDPKRLQSLFRLDHLAARMRRNSDSLLVLAGTSTRRGASGSISVADAVRAAVSEVENYERIDIGETATDHVLGAVGSDLIHLLAEVVDNALAYSPPTSRVAIRGARTPEGGLLIEVADRGLGMPPKDLAAINDQLAHGGDITADTARRMGLYVVGSLAKRHGIAVRLRRNGDEQQGVTVSVHLPAGLLAETSALPERTLRGKSAVAPAPEGVAPTAPAPSAVGGTTKGGLPTRVRGASGAPSTPVPGAAKALPTRTPGAHGPGAVVPPATPAKPVIGKTHGKGVEDAAAKASNGSAAKADEVAPQATNGSAAKVDEPTAKATNGHAAPEPTAPVPTAADSAAQDAPATDGATPTDGAAAPAARSAAGLPVRKPSASRITEYREFEDAPEPAAPAEAAGATAKADAPVAKQSRLTGWLPGRSKAAAEAAAQAEAEANEPRQMPSNLSAWLDHRAKMVEATKSREVGDEPAGDETTSIDAVVAADTEVEATAPAEAPEVEAPVASTDETVEVVEDEGVETPSAESTDVDAPEDLHVPQEWVAEVTGQDDSSTADTDVVAETEVAETEVAAEPGDPDTITIPVAFVDAPGTEPGRAPLDRTTALPTRIPGASGAPTEEVDTRVTGRPALRAHSSSFFGARKARDAQPVAEAPAAEAPVAEAPVAEAPVVEAPVAEVSDTQQATEVEAHEAAAAPLEQTEELPAPVEAVQLDAPVEEPVAEQVAEPAEELVAEPVEETAHLETDEAAPVADAVDGEHPAHDEATEVAQDEAASETQPEPEISQVAKARPVSMNETPIFRAMMSRWLTDDADPAGPSQWAPTEADEAWSAAARIEEAHPLEESPAGLPKRRPGNYLIPGAIESDTPAPAAPAANRRDPEAIRRNLQRHQQGVSSGRTEAQEAHDGNHREEADVHH